MTEPLYEGKNIATEEIVVRGKTEIKLRDKGTGMFLKKTRKGLKISVEQLMHATANKLTEPDPETGKSKIEDVIDSMYNLTQNYSDKSAGAACKAAEFLVKTAWGEAPKSEIDRNENTQPIRVVVIQAPDNMMNKVVTEDKPNEPMKPSWAEVTEVSTNPAPGTQLQLEAMGMQSKTEEEHKQYRQVNLNVSVLLDKNSKLLNNLRTNPADGDTKPLRIAKDGFTIVSGGSQVIKAIWAQADTVVGEVEV